MKNRKTRGGFAFRFVGHLFLGICVGLLALTALLYHPDTPLPDNWNITKSLNPRAKLTLVTPYKVARAASNNARCKAALELGQTRFSALPAVEHSPLCHIRNRTNLAQLSLAKLAPLDMRCGIALRLLMWELHGVQPAAAEIFGQPVKKIDHFGSYSCRRIAGTSRMSQHATANAIDVSGFRLQDGTQISLKRDWDGAADRARFLREVRQSACDWFRITLSPDYNAAHHDHFHFDQGNWSSCR